MADFSLASNLVAASSQPGLRKTTLCLLVHELYWRVNEFKNNRDGNQAGVDSNGALP
jgi:hypothetical protein